MGCMLLLTAFGGQHPGGDTTDCWIPEAFLEGHGSRWDIAFLIYTNVEKKKSRTQ